MREFSRFDEKIGSADDDSGEGAARERKIARERETLADSRMNPF
jgi:hypothetical protein